MSFEDTHEAPLRSFIEARARNLQTEIERTARDRNELSATDLERRVDEQSDHFIVEVQTRLDQMRQDIKARRPTDKGQADYASQMAQYQQFVSSASVGVQRVTAWVNRIFARIIDVIKQAVKWIVDTAETVIDIIEMIRDSFNEFVRFLSR